MKRHHFLAAEMHGYSFANYADHLGIGHVRYEKLMPNAARCLEQAEREGWDDQRLAKALDIPLDKAPEWRKRYQDALEVVDAKTPVEAFRNGVRQSLTVILGKHHPGDAVIEDAVTQICYRAADLAYLLDQGEQSLSDYSKELRREPHFEDDEDDSPDKAAD